MALTSHSAGELSVSASSTVVELARPRASASARLGVEIAAQLLRRLAVIAADRCDAVLIEKARSSDDMRTALIPPRVKPRSVISPAVEAPTKEVRGIVSAATASARLRSCLDDPKRMPTFGSP